MPNIKWITALAFLALVFSCGSEETTETIPIPDVLHEVLDPVSFASNLSKHDAFLLIDLRTPEEFKSGHLKGAINMNYIDPGFQDSLQQLETNIPVFIYSQNGHRSTKAVSVFKKRGFTVIYELKGGYEQIAL